MGHPLFCDWIFKEVDHGKQIINKGNGFVLAVHIAFGLVELRPSGHFVKAQPPPTAMVLPQPVGSGALYLFSGTEYLL